MKRPLGVWGIATVAALWGTVSLGLLIYTRVDPPVCHNCFTIWDSGYGGYAVVLFALITVSAIGLFFRLRPARIGLLAALAVYVAWFILGQSLEAVSFAAEEHPEFLSTISFWWAVSWPVVAAAVAVGLVGWFLFSTRRSEYFSGAGDIKDA